MAVCASLRVLTLVAFCWQAFCWQASWAQESAAGARKTAVGPANANQSRQLATVNPLSVAPPAALLKKPFAPQKKPLTPQGIVTKKVPSGKGQAADASAETSEPWGIVLKGLDEDVADAIEVFSKRAGKIASSRFTEVAHVFGDFCRQVSGPPAVTPVGGPYMHTSASRKQVWTQEGRVKTVVER